MKPKKVINEPGILTFICPECKETHNIIYNMEEEIDPEKITEDARKIWNSRNRKGSKTKMKIVWVYR